MTPLEVSRRFPASALRASWQGQTLVLRNLSLSDAVGVAQAVEESLPALKMFMPWAHFPQSLESQVARIRANLTAAAEGKDFAMGLFGSDERLLVGTGLHPRTHLNPNALEIGYWTRSSETGRGLATFASRLLIVYAFEALGCDRVQISHNSANTASERVIAKCGFVHEGEVRNLTSKPSEACVEAGLHPGRVFRTSALTPEDLPNLPWYATLRNSVEVFDLLGQARGTLFLKS
jgi:ribosomal-protein-serine acetyltransferase